MIFFLLLAVVSAPRCLAAGVVSGAARLWHRAVFTRVMVGNGALDVLKSPFSADAYASPLQLVLRTIADLRAQHDVDALKCADNAVEGGILAEAALAIGVVDLAMTDKGNPGG